MRIDKWLWAARFYKTRSLAQDEIDKNRVSVNGQVVKASKELKTGDSVFLRQGDIVKTVIVLGLSHLRGPAPKAQLLYSETVQSAERRAAIAEQHRLAPEPAMSIEHGRPTKRNRRELEATQKNWGKRWTAAVDNAPF